MPTCPAGHSSDDNEYCETCGVRMSSASATRLLPAVPATPSAPSVGPHSACPECGDSLVDRFCEGCGFDTLHQRVRRAEPPARAVSPSVGTATGEWSAPASPDGGWGPGGITWLAVVSADRGYYERLMAESGSDPTSLPYPAYHPERQYPLTAQFLRIGRHSVGRGIRPDIDLGLPPEDPAVSHEHAVLLSKPHGSWSLVDLGATNGTLLNDSPDPLSAHIEVPLQDGDRIYLGAWTVITLRKG